MAYKASCIEVQRALPTTTRPVQPTALRQDKAFATQAPTVCCSDVSRRNILQSAALVLAGAAIADQPTAQAAADIKQYTSATHGYTLTIPSGWEQYDKQGADAIFRDPNIKYTNVGVTVLPVMIKTLGQFGDLQSVTDKLVAAEKAKESTLSVDVLSSTQRDLATGTLVYDIEYELDTTRGRKRIFNTVTIINSKLYIVNGQVWCGKEGSCDAQGTTIDIVKSMTNSFTV